jgi:hypothetical protein
VFGVCDKPPFSPFDSTIPDQGEVMAPLNSCSLPTPGLRPGERVPDGTGCKDRNKRITYCALTCYMSLRLPGLFVLPHSTAIQAAAWPV